MEISASKIAPAEKNACKLTGIFRLAIHVIEARRQTYMSLSAKQKSFLITLYKTQEGSVLPVFLTPKQITPPIVPEGWTEYGPSSLPPAFNYDPPLRASLRTRHLIDSGAGAIWKWLEQNDLVEVRHEVVIVDGNRGRTLLVRLTPKGRGLVEVILGIKKRKADSRRAKSGTSDLLSFSAWRVLVYLRAHDPQHIPISRAWEKSLPPAYILANIFKSLTRRGLVRGDLQAASITLEGITFYEETFVRHSERYPSIKTYPSKL